MSTRRNTRVALFVAVVLAGLLRFSHLDWDSLLDTHPDERWVLFVASSLRVPEQPSDLLRPAYSTLNPFRASDPEGGLGTARSFAYGHLPLYAMVVARPLVSPLLRAAHPDPFEQLTLAGRGLSALADTLTVLVIGLLARHLYGERAAWLAAAFGALALLHIQQAHFATVDSILTLFVTSALWFMTHVASGGHSTRRASLLAGACAGLALGSKASALLLVLPLMLVHLRRDADRWRVDARLWTALLAMGLAFAVTNPYALLELPLFALDIGTQTALVRGRMDVAFTRQFTGTLPIWYFIQQQGLWALGLPLTVACYVGLGRATWAARSKDTAQPAALPLLAWVWLNLLVVGTQSVKFPRYMLPVTPVLFVFAAGLFRERGRVRDGLAGAVLVLTALHALAFVRLYDQPHPWLAASEWLYDHVPQGAAIAVEQGDDALPLDLDTGETQRRAALYYHQLTLDPYAAESNMAGYLGNLAASDYLVLASNRLYGTVPRLDDRYPLAAATYRNLFAGHLGFTLERAFTRYPNLFGPALVDDTLTRPGLPAPDGLEALLPAPNLRLPYADETLTVYDHPLILVFRNDAHLSADQMQAIVEGEG